MNLFNDTRPEQGCRARPVQGDGARAYHIERNGTGEPHRFLEQDIGVTFATRIGLAITQHRLQHDRTCRAVTDPMP